MIRGSLTEADWARLRDYTRTVSKFIVTDKDSEARISPAVFLRLARLQHPDMPLLPSLSDLVIVDADASITNLELLLTPSLNSLKASCIPEAQQSTFCSFLTAIEQEVPVLQTLILGPGRFLPSSLQTISKFNSLRHLELKHEDSKLPLAFFDNVGSLPMLNTFILDARHVSGTATGDEPTVPPASKSSPSDIFPNSNAMDGNRNEHGAADVGHSEASPTPICSFKQLATLHVIGWLPLLEDLIHRVTSTRLEDVSITFIRLSHDELNVSLAKEKAERERKAEEDRRREEAEKKMAEQKKLWEEEMERKRMAEEIRWREELDQKKKRDAELLLGYTCGPFPPSSPMTPICEPLCEPEWPPSPQPKNHSLFGFNDFPPSPRPSSPVPWGCVDDPAFQEPTVKHQVSCLVGSKKKKPKKLEVVQERSLREREQERLTNLSFDAHTVSFTEILRKLCCHWTTSLKSLSVHQLDESFQCLLEPPTLPEDVFRTMLLLPAIESLEVKGWVQDSVEDVLSTAKPIPNLKSLLLPLGGPNSGISLPTLRHVAKTCPKLESFKCYIDSRSPIPEYSIPTNVGLSHGLRILSVGSSFPLQVPASPGAKQLELDYLIARHLYLLFPKLETINTSEEHDAELWATVDKFVKMFQTARMDDLNRQ